MISSKKRLSNRLFLGFLKKGRVFHSPLLSFRVVLGEELGCYAVVVSKQVAKTAVARNKLRRQGYYLFNKHITRAFPRHTVILFIKKTIPFKELEKEFLSLMSRAGLIL
ncbi:MAG: ribonuclease P protein component [Patescibacteria group bacterium]